MATTPPMISGSDPSVLRSLETPTPSVARTSPPTVSATTGAATSGGTAVARGIAPQVSGATTTYNQATQTASGTSLTITSATSNDPADVVTVYNTNKAISVSAVNQTVSRYNVNNYAGNEYTNSDVANYLPTFTGNVGAGNVNVTGTVYTSGISSTGSASLTIVNVSTTANLGAVGNIIITGGTAGQVLSTNGSGVLSWVSDATTYGNSNVVTLMGAFGSNTISTTGLITGNGAGLSNVPYANVTGTPTLGNIANVNLDGNVSNLMTGTGTFVAIPTVPSVGNIATINLDGNVSNLMTGTGTFVAIPTVPSVGNIATINLDGNVSNVLSGNGTWIAAGGGGGANTGNVTFDDVTVQGVNGFGLNLSAGPEFTANLAYLQVRSGDVASHIHLDTGNNTAYDLIVGNDDKFVQVSSTGNIVMSSYDGNISQTMTFDTTGNLSLAGDIIGPASANFTIYSNAAVHEFIFGDDGTFYAPDNVVMSGNSIALGPGADTLGGLAHAVLVASSNHFAYIQGAIHNVSDNGSADWVAQGAKGDDDGGWADLGFTSSGFSDANYTITSNGDGYVFVQSYAPGQTLLGGGGNLVLATGNQGTTKDIIFGTGGFLTTNIFGRISNANNSFELSRAGATITFPDATEQNTAWTGSLTTIANGNSNVSIATANGNVTIAAVGNTTMTVTGTGANVTGTLTSTGKIGYASGSTVTQTTNRGNGVTINALAGTIITTSASMVANQIDTFSVANDQVDPNNDIVLVQIVSPNFGVYNCIAQPSATISVSLTGFYINIVNISGFTTTSDAITIRFMVIKAPNA